MPSSTELKTTAETLVSPRSIAARWYKTTSSTTHSPESGLNPLVDSSAHAFEHIHLLTQSSFSSEAKKNIETHLESLQKHYQHLGYSQDISLAAHYALCATLDDLLRCTGSDGQFLQTFHNSRLEQEKFYSILNHISPKADQYIDLLELMYLCLRFGYKGQYRNTPFGLQQWSLLTDNTYHLIAHARGQRSQLLSPNLFVTPPSQALPALSPIKQQVANKKQHRFYLLALALFMFFAIVAGFIFRETYNTTREALNKHTPAASYPYKKVQETGVAA